MDDDWLKRCMDKIDGGLMVLWTDCFLLVSFLGRIACLLLSG